MLLSFGVQMLSGSSWPGQGPVLLHLGICRYGNDGGATWPSGALAECQALSYALQLGCVAVAAAQLYID